jgi:predicted nuclease of predicted toxin-antitoxin system
MRLLVDENFHGAIVCGLLRRRSQLDLVRVYDVGLGEAEDSYILEWAATQGRLVLTHDAATLISIAYERVAAGKVMPGIIGVLLTT